MPSMSKNLNVDSEMLGRILTINGVIYGLGKFANGIFGDRAHARAMMVVGLAGSAILNICFGMSSTLVTLGIFWMLNGWFQGMGYPPCARLITHWFPPRELATKMSIWNISHQVGALLIVVLCGYLVAQWGWRSCFFVPAAIALVTACFLWSLLPDTPPSVGLPEVEGTHHQSGAQSGAEFKAFLSRRVFRNKFVWLVSISNFFVYIIRYSVFNWGPTLLTRTKNIQIVHAGWMMAGFECAGLFGALLSGWLTDRFFGGRAMRVGVFYMTMAGVSVFLFWKVPEHREWLSTLLLASTGFFVYGPQCLVSIAAANLATKRAAATAVGLTSIFGYGSTVLSGWGLGWLSLHYGWDAAFESLLAITVLGVLVFAACWPAQAHGYDD